MAANTATCLGTIDSDIAIGGDRVYRVKYQVQTTDVDDQSLTAVQAAGIPSIGSHYAVGNDSDAGAFVSRYSPSLVSERDSRKVWEVVVTFSSASTQRDETEQPVTSYDYPWLAPARISGSGFKQEVQSRFHYPDPNTTTKEPCTSSAGEVYDDVYRDESTFGLRIDIDYAINAWALNDTLEYLDTLNSNEFWGAPAGYYRLGPPQYQLLFTGQGIPYWSVSYDFEGRYGGWNHEQHIDEGTYYIEQTTGKRRRFDDDWKLTFSGKGKLDGSGTGDRLPAVIAQTTTEYWPDGGLNKYLLKDFADLGIPTSVSEVLSGR